jgi:hypothetical protein
MAQPHIALSALAKLRSNFAGTVLQAGDPEYDSVRALHNGLIDKRPAVIARDGGFCALGKGASKRSHAGGRCADYSVLADSDRRSSQDVYAASFDELG